jgi:hypothetical protein
MIDCNHWVYNKKLGDCIRERVYDFICNNNHETCTCTRVQMLYHLYTIKPSIEESISIQIKTSITN